MRKFLPALIISICLLMMTAVFFSFTIVLVKSQAQLEFDQLASDRSSAIQRSLREKYLVLESMHSVYSALGGAPEPEYSLMSRPFEAEVPGVLGYRWVIPVDGEGRDQFEISMQGFFDGFQIIEVNSQGNLQKAALRPIHYPLMPLPGYPDIFDGFDLSSNTDSLNAIERSIILRGVATSDFVLRQSVQTTDINDYVFQTFIPVFIDNSTEPLGIVAGLYNLTTIINSATSDLEPQTINMTLYDAENESEDRSLLYEFLVEEEQGVRSAFSSYFFTPTAVMSSLQAGDRTWYFSAEPAPSYFIDNNHSSPWIVLLIGLLLSIIIPGYFVFYTIQHNRIVIAEQETKDVQIQLFRTQKVDAVGQLASGIAHDFNNILTGILGYSSLAQELIANRKEEEVLNNYLNEVLKAGEKGRNLISKLSSFNRNNPLAASQHDLNQLVVDALELLRPSITSEIEITFTTQDKLQKVVVDATNFEQIVVNLCINARDAILEGNVYATGSIEISLEKVSLKSAECSSCHKIIKGKYIKLSIKDSGHGISEETTQMIFTPFFTTKETGKGTGMGLSIIHGIVHSHDGHILLHSEQGEGADFQILFPVDS